MKPCPNCGQPVEPLTRLCPHCGADTRDLWRDIEPTDALSGPLLQRRRRQDAFMTILGLLVALMLGLFPFVGSLMCVIVGLTSKKKEPAFCKGLFYGAAAGLLGWTLICFGPFLKF